MVVGCLPAFSQPASTPGPPQVDLLDADHAVSGMKSHSALRWADSQILSP
jgi:hypothetical protein